MGEAYITFQACLKIKMTDEKTLTFFLDLAYKLEKNERFDCTRAKNTEGAFTHFIEQFDAASEAVKEKLKHQLPFAFNSRGLARYRQVEFKAAISDFNKAISLEPSVDNFHYNCGLVLYRLKDFDVAQIHLEKALALNPDHDSALKCLESLKDMNN